MYCVLKYIIQELVKTQYKTETLTQKAIIKKRQPFQNIKVKNGSNHKSKSQFAKQNTTSKSKALCT